MNGQFYNSKHSFVKFIFSKKATKIDEIFTDFIWRLLHTVKLTVKILSIFVVFSENVNFKKW